MRDAMGFQVIGLILCIIGGAMVIGPAAIFLGVGAAIFAIGCEDYNAEMAKTPLPDDHPKEPK